MPADEAVAIPAPHAGRALSIVAASFAIALIALFLAYLSLAAPGAWFSTVDSKLYGARALAVAVGNGVLDGDALVVMPADASGTIIVTVAVAIRAGDYPGVAWHVTGLPVGTEARLLWRNQFKPGRTFTMDIPVEADRLAPIVAARNPNWIGPVNGVALALRLPVANEPVRIVGVTADTLSVRSLVGSRLRDWTAFEPWTGASINTVVGGADLQELPLPPLFGLAALLATAITVGLGRWRPHWIGAGLPLALAATFGAAWLALDARWQWNLARQVRVTASEYSGKSWRDKHVAAEDGQLFQFIEKVRATLPRTPARVFMVADAHYFRGRGAYHLYPHNVHFDPWRNTVPPPLALRPGDYLVVYQRRGIQFDAAKGLLRWDSGPPVAAESLLVEPGAALFRIR